MVKRIICEQCGEEMKKYDKVKRKVRSKRGEIKEIVIQRYYCKSCRRFVRDIPDDILFKKRYEREVIEGVKEGLINADTLGFEDYPCEKQMKRWLKE